MKLIIKLAILFVLIFNVNLAKSQEKLIFTPASADKQILSGAFDYFEDAKGDMTFEMVSKLRENDFKPLLNNNLGFGYDKVLWIRYSINFINYHESNFFITENFPHLGDLKLFYPQKDGSYNFLELIDTTPLTQRAFAIHNNLFQVPSNMNNGIGTFYMRYNPKGNFLLVDLSFSGQKGLVESIDREMAVNGIFFGGLIAMWFYNLLLYFKLRTRDYLYYLYYLGCMTGMFIYINGFSPILIDNPQTQKIVFGILSFGSCHGAILFAREFLSMKQYTPRLDKIVWILQWVIFGAMIAVLFAPTKFISPALHYLALFSCLVVAAGIIRLRQGFLPARYYLAGWAIYIIALIIYLLGSINIFPINFFTTYLFHAASFWEAILFAYSVVYRLKLADESAAQAKNTFLAMISHELKTPLQAIVSSIDILSLKMPQNDKILFRLRSATSNLELQVKDLTDYSHLGSESFKLINEEVNISDAASEVLKEFEKLANDKGLKIIANIEPNIVCVIDQYRFQQILQNLISNSIKYTNVGHIEVQLKLLDLQSKIFLMVKDTGIGFNENTSKNLFEPFTQANKKSTRAYSGMGMGLSIVKKIVDVFRGNIEVHSSLGIGSTFTVTLPIDMVTDSEMVIDPNISYEDSGNSVLLVDDSDDVRDDLSIIIDSLGYQCDAVSGGSDAIKIAMRKKYSAILLDVNMPEIDGIEVAKHLRNSSGPNRDVPLIWISATSPINSSIEDKQYFTHFLDKPIYAAKLNEMLKKIISQP